MTPGSARRLPARSVCGLALAVLLVAAAGARASDDAHRKEDQAKHQRIAQAHATMADCLGADRDPKACLADLQAACKGIAIGPQCGMKRGAEDFRERAARVAEHRRMAGVHEQAAQCLASTRPYGDCGKALSAACGGVGVGRYCGLRHAH